MTESVEYNVESKDGDIEIRRYSDHILAQVDVASDFENAMRIGFSILSRYIFGENKNNTKMPMTTPVMEEKVGEEVYRISFIMPFSYSLETLPETEDKRIKFKQINNREAATLHFPGRAKRRLANEKIEELKKWLSENGIKPKSNFIVAQYNQPSVPGSFRKNEIIVDI